MNSRSHIALAFLTALLLLVGCKKKGAAPKALVSDDKAAVVEFSEKVLSTAQKKDWKAFVKLLPKEANQNAIREVFDALQEVQLASDPKWKCESAGVTVSAKFTTANGGSVTLFLRKENGGWCFINAQ